jgi:nucleoside-diphosphate-sugar epimerase
VRILVAGATGVVGRALLPLLREQGHHVVALLRESGPVPPAGAAEAVTADALDPTAVRSAVERAKPDLVVHQLTALRGLGGPGTAEALESTARLRTEGTANLLAASRAAGVRRIVAQSIAFAARPGEDAVVDEDAPLYTDPGDPAWARTFQAVAELERLLLGTRDIEAVVLRLGTLHGPGTAYAADGPTGAALGRGRLPLIGDGSGVTSFVHVDDAARAVALALGRPARGLFHITDDDPAPASAWVPALAARFGGPAPRTMAAATAQRLFGWFPVWQQTAMRGASNVRAGQLGWRPAHPSWREPA